MKIKNYTRLKPNEFRPCTIGLTPENYDKIKSSDIYFSQVVNDYLINTDIKILLKKYPKNERYSFKNTGRVVSSITLSYDLSEKIDCVNLTCLVNDLIKKILK